MQSNINNIQETIQETVIETVDVSEYVMYADRLPKTYEEVGALLVAVILTIAVFTCLFTSTKKLIASTKKSTKIKAYFLVLLIAGQLMVATALLERSVQGAHNDPALLSGIVMWVIGRAGVEGTNKARLVLGRRKRLKAKQNKT